MSLNKDKNQLSGKVVGFTLIELLVVIAVLSVLLAILLPVLSKIRMLSKRTVCQGNLRQIAIAWQFYFDDHSGRFLRGVDADFLYGGWKSLHYKVKERPLNKYIGLSKQPQTESEAKIFRCPSDLGDIETYPFSTYSSRGNSYGTNILLIGYGQIGRLDNPETEELRNLRREINARLPDLRSNHIDGSARLILVGDMPGAMEWIPDYPDPESLPDYPYPDQHNWHGHQDKYNWAFLDGHVTFLKIQKGIFLNSEYTVIPFRELYPLAIKAQEYY